VGVQEVRLDGCGTEPAGEYTFSFGKGNENHQLGTNLWYIRESYMKLRGLSLLIYYIILYYIILIGRLYDIIFLKIHASEGDTTRMQEEITT
jgi:hypothetical protein